MSNAALDKGIAIAIMLFLLSMIAERIVTWIKLQFGQRGHWLMGFSTVDEDLTTRTDDPDKEAARERQILGLNLVTSILIALSSHADLFAIMNGDAPFSTLGWTTTSAQHSLTDFWLFLEMVLGCVLVGMFISLGSKFWHDTLNMLQAVKNIKQKLADSSTFEVSSVAQLDEFVNLNESDLVHMAITQNESLLKRKFTNIHFINNSVALINGKKKNVARIYLFDSKSEGIPAQLPVRLQSGKIYNVLTDVVTGSALGRPTMSLTGAVDRVDDDNYKGSACCIATDTSGNTYLITCCHVLTNGDLANPQFNTGNKKVEYDSSTIGPWTYGRIDHTGDFAQVSITDPDEFISNYSPESFGNQLRTINLSTDYFLPVTVRGRKTQGAGYIIDLVANNMGIGYNFGQSQIFDTVILVGDQPSSDCGPASQDGDSGGVVFDAETRMIGIIAGVTPKYTLVLPLQVPIANLSLTLT
jgi:hypothetical protein